MMSIIARRACLLLLLATGIAAEAQEAPKSLLFTPTEADAVAKAMAEFDRMNVTGQSVEEAAAPQGTNIYVSAIVDYGEGRWTVWANGYRISPERQPPQFTVLAVKDDLAEIRVSGDKQDRILLRPYQTWLARSHSIVEGIFP